MPPPRPLALLAAAMLLAPAGLAAADGVTVHRIGLGRGTMSAGGHDDGHADARTVGSAVSIALAMAMMLHLRAPRRGSG